MQIILFVLMILGIEISALAQMGPAQGGPPSLFSAEGLWGEPNSPEGIDRQFLLSTGLPIAKTESLSIFSQLNYQSLALQNAPFPQLSSTHFESLVLSLNANFQQQSGNGWVIGGSIGSASDKIFTSSDVLTHNLIVQRKNKWSETSAFLYGFFYSNNNALLPGLPIPTFAYEVQNKESGDFLRIGFPLVWRKNNVFSQTHLSLFAIGPAVWDIHLKNTALSDLHVTLGAQKRPETFLLSSSTLLPLDQLMVEQIAVYSLMEWNSFERCKIGFKAAYNFTNHYRLRETGTTRDDFDQDRRFPDYASFSINLRFLAPIKPPQ